MLQQCVQAVRCAMHENGEKEQRQDTESSLRLKRKRTCRAVICIQPLADMQIGGSSDCLAVASAARPPAPEKRAPLDRPPRGGSAQQISAASRQHSRPCLEVGVPRPLMPTLDGTRRRRRRQRRASPGNFTEMLGHPLRRHAAAGLSCGVRRSYYDAQSNMAAGKHLTRNKSAIRLATGRPLTSLA